MEKKADPAEGPPADVAEFARGFKQVRGSDDNTCIALAQAIKPNPSFRSLHDKLVALVEGGHA